MSIINNGAFPADLDTIEQLMYFVNAIGGGNAIAPLAALSGASAPTFSTHTLSSGVAYENAGTVTETIYVAITGGTAGTVGIVLTDTTPTAHTIVPVVAANAVASQVFKIPVPAGWSITVTTSVATINASSVITTGL